MIRVSEKNGALSAHRARSEKVIYRDTCEMDGRHMQPFTDCLAKHWKKSLKDGKTELRVFSAADLEGVRYEDGLIRSGAKGT
jgi:hypothetical protein